MTAEQSGFVVGYYMGAFLFYFGLSMLITWFLTGRGVVDKSFGVKSVISFVIMFLIMSPQANKPAEVVLTLPDIFMMSVAAQGIVSLILYSRNKKAPN